MRIVLLGGANSIHTVRWANALVFRDCEVHLISAHPVEHELSNKVIVHQLGLCAPWAYLGCGLQVRKIVSQIQPDILNVHYATGYGTLARLVGFVPTLLSVWGSDIYLFPNKSPLHKWLLTGNLKSATAIASTSHCMAARVAKIQPRAPIFHTPFGVDLAKFEPKDCVLRADGVLIVGTVKGLSPVYGVDTLLDAFGYAWHKLGRPSNVFLEIAGEGPSAPALKEQAINLGLVDQVKFLGFVPHEHVPRLLKRFDIFVALSRFESFGVAALEAAAIGLPVVVSDAEGLSEVTVAGVTGLVVPKEDATASGQAIFELLTSATLRQKLGASGRQHVVNNYDWQRSVDLMLDAYEATIRLGNELANRHTHLTN